MVALKVNGAVPLLKAKLTEASPILIAELVDFVRKIVATWELLPAAKVLLEKLTFESVR